ncbi:MAG: putative nucleoside-diphosphate-sugar epimerase [uncultured Caballeronia sp.]|nr:MAG: putative nucleoside-diphosphate-sugar epimerase [uncultured Caballeronia sp.]
MFAVSGITGQVGGVVARLLLAAGHDVRAVVRDAAKGEVWSKQGCEVALVDVNDQQALQHAFEGAEGVFVLLLPTFDPTPGFPEARKTIATLRAALAAAKPSKVVVLSTIGAQATQPNLLNQLQILEQELGTLPMPVVFLRAAWFIENAAWDVASARDSGIVPSFLQPLDKRVPMVATADIGCVAADLLRESWTGRRIVELEGPQRISPDMIAESFARLLGCDVSTTAVPRDTWEDLFRSQGMKNPTPRMQMIDGFNAEWICFEGAENEVRKGRMPLDTVLQSLIEKAS